MIPRLKENQAFTKDYKNYQQRIAKVTNEQTKKELVTLLLELSREVDNIDLCHEQMLITNKMPGTASETRSAIASCRKRLETKLAQWEKSNP
jgi:hypothetical protein